MYQRLIPRPSRFLIFLVLAVSCLWPAALFAQQAEPAVTELHKPKEWVSLDSFAFGPNGKYVAGGMGIFTLNGHVKGGDVVLWAIKGGKVKKIMSGHTAAVTTLAFTADGKQLVSVSPANGEVRVFDVRRGKEKNLFRTPVLDPTWTSVAPLLSADGGSLVHFEQAVLDIAGKPKRITGALEAWDVATGKVRWRRERTHAETVVLSPDGSLVAYYAQELNYKVVDGKVNYSSPNSVVHVLNRADGAWVRTIKVGYMPIGGLAFTADNLTLLAVNGSLRQFSVADGKQIRQKVDTGIFGGLTWLKLAGDGSRAALNGRYANDIQLWDLTAKPPKSSQAVLVTGAQQPMRFSDDFSLLACEIKGQPALLKFTGKGKRRR